MNDTTKHRIDEFLHAFGKALRHPGGSREEMIAEIRADLAAHIEHHRLAGKSQAEAVDLALAELGDPLELARQVGPAATPLGGPVVTTVRYMAGGGLFLWTLLMVWVLRAGSYGLTGLAWSLGIALLHLPLVFLVWPRIVWRKNWLFGLIPAGLAFAIALVLAVVGVRHESEIMTTVEEESSGLALTIPERAREGQEDFQLTRMAPFGVAGGVTLFLLLAMQRRAQRRTALLAMLLGVVVVEMPYQVEEWVFRSRVQSALKLGKDGSSLAWSRPLSPGHTIVYHFAEDRIEVRD